MTPEPPDMTPATRHDVQTLGAELRAELASKADLERFATKVDLRDLEGRLMAQFAKMADAMAEHFRQLFGVLSDKDKQLEGDLVALRHEHDAHVADTAIHHTHVRARKRTRPARR